MVNHEKPVIDEIIYNSDYYLRHLPGDNKIVDENLKKEAPVLDIIQQVFNNVNQHYSWIVAGNKRGYYDEQLNNAKVSMDNMFYVVLQNLMTKTPLRKLRRRVTILRSFCLCLARGVMWHPGSEKPERPVFQPKDRGEVFWNTALLDIEQISSCYKNNNTRV